MSIELAEVRLERCGLATAQPQHRMASRELICHQKREANKLETNEAEDEKSDVAVWRSQSIQRASLR